MRIKRSSSVRWDAPVCPISPTSTAQPNDVPQHPLDVSSASRTSSSSNSTQQTPSRSAAAPSATAGAAAAAASAATTIGTSGGQRVLRVPGMQFFDLSLSTSPLLDPAASSSGSRGSLSDTTVEVLHAAIGPVAPLPC